MKNYSPKLLRDDLTSDQLKKVGWYYTCLVSSCGEMWEAPKKSKAHGAKALKRKTPLKQKLPNQFDIDFITPAEVHLEYIYISLQQSNSPVKTVKAQDVINRYRDYGQLSHAKAAEWHTKMEGPYLD